MSSDSGQFGILTVQTTSEYVMTCLGAGRLPEKPGRDAIKRRRRLPESPLLKDGHFIRGFATHYYLSSRVFAVVKLWPRSGFLCGRDSNLVSDVALPSFKVAQISFDLCSVCLGRRNSCKTIGVARKFTSNHSHERLRCALDMQKIDWIRPIRRLFWA